MTSGKINSKTKYPFNIKCAHEFTVYASTKEEALEVAQEKVKSKNNINEDIKIEYISPVMSLDEIISSD